MLNKKAQSAMEYLMTYGWAILVVLIALGALFYLGVFSPRTPNSCVGSPPITCIDTKAVDLATVPDKIDIVVGASGVSWANITSVTGTCGQTTITPNLQISTQTTTALPMNSTTCAISKGDKFTGTASVSYKLTGGPEHTTTIQYSGTVE